MIYFDEKRFEIVDYEEPEVLINPNPIIKPYTPYIPPVKQLNKENLRRIYEDDNFTVDLFVKEKMVRVSIFKDGHFKDEVFVRKDEYID